MINITARNYRHIQQPMIALLVCASSISAHAALTSDNSERRIQVRQGSNVYIEPSTNGSIHSPGITMLSGDNVTNGDSMQGLIAQKQRDFNLDARLSIEENKRVNINRRPTYGTEHNHEGQDAANNDYNDAVSMDFNVWLNNNSYRAKQVAEYQRYLSSQVGSKNVPPLSQLLTTARSWSKCGYEPYQLPPQELWANIVPTLRLYSELKQQGILPASSEIRSVYRSPGLNDCAGGADSSKHMNASAMDIWVPEYEYNPWQRSTMQDGLCQFWQYQGSGHNFGLGLYATGAIHLDTDGYRKWGFNHASSGSPCRY
ncbi:peptidase M15A [Psychrobacter sp. NG25]|nr:peptidase M15A [Psychrobacter sp. NG25]